MHRKRIGNRVTYLGVLRLKLGYGYLDHESVADLLNDVIRGRKQDDDLRQLVLQTARDLRPTLDTAQPGEPCWKHFAAMSMRWFPALGAAGEPATVPEVRGWLAHDRALTYALLFGDDALLDRLGDEGLTGEGWRSELPAETKAQAEVLDFIRYHLNHISVTERQVGNWSVAMLDDWDGALYDALSMPILRGVSNLMNRAVLRLGGVEQYAGPEQLREYVDRFDAAGLDWAAGQALGYYTEVRRRYRLVRRAATRLLASSMVAAAGMILLGLNWLLSGGTLIEIVSALVFTIGALGVVLQFLRAMRVLVRLAGPVEAQLEALAEIESRYLRRG